MATTGIIDIHCHVLPGVDDGSRSMEESLELLRMAKEQGVVSVIATPHYSRRSQDTARKTKAEALRTELEQRAREEIDPDYHVWLGQETFYHEELAERILEGYGWSMAGSRYVLIEFDTGANYDTIFRGLRKVSGLGYIPILAHIERFPAIRREGGLAELKRLGTLFQMNYDSLEGSIFNAEARWCRQQVKEGIIDLMGSDMHQPAWRPPQIREGYKWMQKHLEESEVRRMTWLNPIKIVQDEEI